MKKIISLFAAILSLFAIGKAQAAPVETKEPENILPKEEPKQEVKQSTLPRKTFDERLTEKVQHLRKAEIDRKLKNGAQEFTIGGKVFIARDLKNAIRKAKNAGIEVLDF